VIELVSYEALIDNIRNKMERNGGDTDLRELAQRFGLTQAHFSRIFRDVSGMTCRDYLIEIKVNKSKELLLKDSIPIKEIAYELGYTNPSHFSYMFKKKLGITPTQYRKNSAE
jgi:AraC-like DNA-binding protein